MKTKPNISRSVLPVIALIAVVGNVMLWNYGKNLSLQISTIVFVLVWLNLVLAVFTYRRQPNLSHILLGAILVLELLLSVNLFWVIGRIM